MEAERLEEGRRAYFGSREAKKSRSLIREPIGRLNGEALGERLAFSHLLSELPRIE